MGTESSLLHLCEFIEDCEFTRLSTEILHLLGELGPSTSAPARYIRFIYNRVILENAAVRAAAVSSLSKFAASCPSLRSSIMTLLKRSLIDEDDEARDRAAISVRIIEEAMEQHPYVQPLTSSRFPCELRFTVTEVDPATGEEEGGSFEEEYPLEDLEITTSDFMAKFTVPDFRKAWENAGNSNEGLEKFALQFKKMEDAVVAIISFLGMQPCDGTGQLKPGNTGSAPHMLHLSGSFLGGQQVLARAQVAMAGDSTGQVIFKIAVRSDSEQVSRMVADCIH